VYDPVLPQHSADVLSRLFALFRKAPGEALHRSGSNVDDLSPNLLMNLRQSGSAPSPRQLHALKLRLSMTTGGVFKLFRYSLDRMREVEFLLNGERTWFVESYPFYRDRPVDLPGVLGEFSSFQHTAFLSELVVSWQQGVPIRALHGRHWQRDGFLYAQLGSSDALALPRIPPGSCVAILPIGEKERRNPAP
jgi:hypothetical protein